MTPTRAGFLARAPDWAARRHGRACAVLLALALLCFLPGFFALPPIDRDEARFAQTTRQMLETGNYIEPRFQGGAHYRKPAGLYWLQAAAVTLANAAGLPDARARIWLYRLPSLVAATGSVLLVYWTALAFTGRRGALLAAAMMAGCVLLGVEARLAQTDAVLLLSILAAQGVLAHGLTRAPTAGQPAWRGSAPVFWSALALGMLVKGPIILLVVGATVLGTVWLIRPRGWLRPLRPVAGLCGLLLLVLPWLVAIDSASGGAFFSESLGRDLIGKVLAAQESHWGPPGYHLALLWLGFWPAAPLLALAAPDLWRQRRDPRLAFLWAWLAPAWLLFEAIPTKLPHYVLPLYPALAILLARWLEQGGAAPERPRWLRHAGAWWPGLSLVLAALALAIRQPRGPGDDLAAWPLLAVALALAWVARMVLRRRGAEPALLVALAAGVALQAAVLHGVLPGATRYFPAPALVAAARQAGCGAPRLATAGYEEPSLIFLGGTDTLITDAAGAARFLGGGGCRVAIIDAAMLPAFETETEALGLRYRHLTTLDAVNYSKGRALKLSAFATMSD